MFLLPANNILKRSSFLSPFLPPSGISAPYKLPWALHLSGLLKCFLIWLVGTGSSMLADYNSASSHFQFIGGLLTHTHTYFPRWPYSLPSPASIQRHSNSRPPSTPTCPLPPFISSPFKRQRKSISKAPYFFFKKRDIVALEAFKVERQIVLYYYLDL